MVHESSNQTTINDEETGEETEVIVKLDAPTVNKPITFFRAWLLPGVAMVMKNGIIRFLQN